MKCSACGQERPETLTELVERARRVAGIYSSYYCYANAGSPVVNMRDLILELATALELTRH